MSTTAVRGYVPTREGNFSGWFNHFADVLVANEAEYYLTPEEVADLSKLKDDWNTHYAASIAASDTARAATELKNETRDAAERLARGIARRIQADNRVTDPQRKEAGLPVHKTTRTPVAIPSTTPRAQVISSDRLEHSISISDSATPTRKARPAGTMGCEAYMAIGGVAPTNPSEFNFIGIWTDSAERVQFEAEDGGKTAHYLMRWVNSRGETGPWSDVYSAIIQPV